MYCLLPESLDISTVLDVTTQYQTWFAHQGAVEVSAENVARVDAAGIQLLSCLFISAKKHRREIYLIKPTQLLTESIQNLGLCEVFDGITKVGE